MRGLPHRRLPFGRGRSFLLAPCGLHTKRVKVDLGSVVFPRLSRCEIRKRLGLEAPAGLPVVPVVGGAYGRATGVVAVKRRRGVSTLYPLDVVAVTPLNPDHRPLQPLAALQQQILPAQDVDPGV